MKFAMSSLKLNSLNSTLCLWFKERHPWQIFPSGDGSRWTDVSFLVFFLFFLKKKEKLLVLSGIHVHRLRVTVLSFRLKWLKCEGTHYPFFPNEVQKNRHEREP